MFEDFEEMKKFISKRVYELRILKNISARDMSLSLGLNRNYVNQIENRKTKPSMKGLFYMWLYLGVSPMEFFNTEKSTTLLQQKAINCIYNVSDKNLEYVVPLLEKLEKE